LARSNAYKDAQSKASDYAGYAKVLLGKTIKITDQVKSVEPPVAFNRKVVAAYSADIVAPTQIVVGDIDITYNV
jgi:uncharacterized protein YggE